MRGYVGITDFGWYTFLRERPELREVNFWRGSQHRFRALQPGELFFFKLKSPHNAIAGFGLFTRDAVLPVWEAWDVFEAANGVPTLQHFLDRLNRISSADRTLGVDDWIGCLAINEPVFFPPDEWVPVPSDFHGSVQSGKGYDLSTGEGRLLYERCLDKAGHLAPVNSPSEPSLADRYGPDQVIRPRLGQASFRLAVLEAYDQRCAVTGEHSLPVVDAAHIRPYAQGGTHEVSNGLPLRRDVHRLFDLGFVSVRPDRTFAVSRALRDDYANGKVYYELDGASLSEPIAEDSAPSPDLLDWHYAEVFRR